MSSPERAPSLRELYPHFDDGQLKHAEDILERYVALTLRIYERIREDPAAWSLLQSLTAAAQTSKIEAARPSSPP